MAAILSLYDRPIEMTAAFLGTRLAERLGPVEIAPLHRDDITMAPIDPAYPRLHIADDIRGNLHIALYHPDPGGVDALAAEVTRLFVHEDLPGAPVGDTRPTVRMLFERASPILNADHERIGELLRFAPARAAEAA